MQEVGQLVGYFTYIVYGIGLVLLLSVIGIVYFFIKAARKGLKYLMYLIGVTIIIAIAIYFFR